MPTPVPVKARPDFVLEAPSTATSASETTGPVGGSPTIVVLPSTEAGSVVVEPATASAVVDVVLDVGLVEDVGPSGSVVEVVDDVDVVVEVVDVVDVELVDVEVEVVLVDVVVVEVDVDVVPPSPSIGIVTSRSCLGVQMQVKVVSGNDAPLVVSNQTEASIAFKR